MAFANNNYVTLGTDVKEGSARVWSSYKNKEGEYVNDFSDFINFIGNARDKAAGLTKGTRIQLKSVAVNNSYNKETGETRYFFKVFDFEVAEPKQ